jgi:hypothetical protein
MAAGRLAGPADWDLLRGTAAARSIEQWKAEHGTVWALPFPEDGKIVVFRECTRAEADLIASDHMPTAANALGSVILHPRIKSEEMVGYGCSAWLPEHLGRYQHLRRTILEVSGFTSSDVFMDRLNAFRDEKLGPNHLQESVLYVMICTAFPHYTPERLRHCTLGEMVELATYAQLSIGESFEAILARVHSTIHGEEAPQTKKSARERLHQETMAKHAHDPRIARAMEAKAEMDQHADIRRAIASQRAQHARSPQEEEVDFQEPSKITSGWRARRKIDFKAEGRRLHQFWEGDPSVEGGSIEDS